MPEAKRLTEFLLQNGLLWGLRCSISILANLAFGFLPYRAPNRFVGINKFRLNFNLKSMGLPGFEPGFSGFFVFGHRRGLTQTTSDKLLEAGVQFT